MEITFLGTGAGNGVPEFYCNCNVCREAQLIPKWRRTRSAITISENQTFLIDAPPELSSQLLRENICQVDYLLLTHAHHDHSAGLGDLEIYSKYYMKTPLPAVMSHETMKQLEKSFPTLHSFLDINTIEPGHTLKISNISLTAIAATHFEGTLGYIIGNCLGNRIAYLPDTGPLSEISRKKLQKIEKLILDATFYGENWFPSEHHTLNEALSTAREVEAGELYLTHLSMHYSLPVTSKEIEAKIKAYGDNVFLAYDGMRIHI